MSKTGDNSNIRLPKGKIGNLSLDMIYRGQKTLGQFEKYWHSAYQASYASLPQDWKPNLNDCLTKFNLQIGETNYNAYNFYKKYSPDSKEYFWVGNRLLLIREDLDTDAPGLNDFYENVVAVNFCNDLNLDQEEHISGFVQNFNELSESNLFFNDKFEIINGSNQKCSELFTLAIDRSGLQFHETSIVSSLHNRLPFEYNCSYENTGCIVAFGFNEYNRISLGVNIIDFESENLD